MKQYKGALSLEAIVTGYNLAMRNAKRLASDAIFLYEGGRLHSAIAIGILAIEEEGKADLFIGLAIESSGEGLKHFWRDYRRHISKNRHVRFLSARGEKKGLLQAAGEAFVDEEVAKSIDEAKQLTIYSDCLNNGYWHAPDLIPMDKVQTLANGLINICRHLDCREVSVKQLEIYVKHMQPVTDLAEDAIAAALVACTRELVANGFLSDPNGFSDEHLIRLLRGDQG